MRLFQHTCPACRDGATCDAVPRRVMLGAAFGLLTAPAMAQSGASGTRSIAVRRVQTGDSFRGVYWRDGRYDRDALHRLDEVLRDPGLDEATPMDPRLFDVLNQVQRRLGSDDMWDVISAYRAPESNAARARESRRVSRVSLHMSGMAVDCRLPGRDSMGIARTAADMQTGGVGLYRRDGFVHLDCGPVRRW
ncbi:DUF882 domain-containing protein [Sabulicella rubraurantiaca]|uniref:DUF882 domain-containing protein n=1 Tax=Sabulicella rubraurantiaca TaxID=2811429 RepID=UPI001A975A8B|nr:DUF882 domain-containing protein [Sabulicella rubraurantiaca]